MHPFSYQFSFALAAGALVCLLLGLYLFRLGTKSREKYDFLKDPPHLWINGLERGFVQVRGKVIADDPLISPLTHSPCCYYRTTLECVEQAAPNGASSYRRICDERKSTRFVIDDGTGKVLVLPGGAEYEFPKTYSAEIDVNLPGVREESIAAEPDKIAAPCEATLREYLSRHASVELKDSTPSDGGDARAKVTYRLTEYCLLAGQESSVFGTCEKYYGPKTPQGSKVICRNEHLPLLVITSRNELTVGPRLRYIALAGYAAGILFLGLSAAGTLLLLYPHLV